jgi:UDP-glucose 4-epimerase
MTRAIVTGAAGFIGGHLVDRLVASGQDVVAIDNLKRASRERLQPHIRAGAVDFVEGDVRDFETLTAKIQRGDVVYHLAAQSNVMGALDDPEYSFTTNAYGTFNILRAAVEAKAARVVFSSSREVYGEPQYTPVDEEHPLAAKNPYGASKLAGEAYCRTFSHCHNLDVAILRLANVYGAGDSGRVIPLWLGNAIAGRDLRVFGGSQVLDFVWIDLVVDALTHAGAHGLAQPTNIGSGSGTSVLELGRRILEVTGSKSSLVRVSSRSAEVTRFVADTARMRALGLQPDADPLAHLPELAAEYAAGVAA